MLKLEIKIRIICLDKDSVCVCLNTKGVVPCPSEIMEGCFVLWTNIKTLIIDCWVFFIRENFFLYVMSTKVKKLP